MQRRLSAIFAADMVGYSRLMDTMSRCSLECFESIKRWQSHCFPPDLDFLRLKLRKLGVQLPF